MKGKRAITKKELEKNIAEGCRLLEQSELLIIDLNLLGMVLDVNRSRHHCARNRQAQVQTLTENSCGEVSGLFVRFRPKSKPGVFLIQA